MLPREKGATYLICIKGKRTYPPEDCGGLWGYVDILEALEDLDNEDYEELLDRIGKDFDPDKRFKFAFE